MSEQDPTTAHSTNSYEPGSVPGGPYDTQFAAVNAGIQTETTAPQGMSPETLREIGSYFEGIPPSTFRDTLQHAWQTYPGLADTMSLEEYVTQNLEWNGGMGPEKPMGYISLADLVSCRKNPASFVSEVVERGITPRLFREGECNIGSGALYSYSARDLQELLDANLDVLTEAQWPTTADQFVTQVAMVSVPAHTQLFDVVADAFGDKRNPGRLERPAGEPEQQYYTDQF